MRVVKFRSDGSVRLEVMDKDGSSFYTVCPELKLCEKREEWTTAAGYVFCNFCVHVHGIRWGCAWKDKK